MKIIYKVSIATCEDKKFNDWYFFDTYENVKEWLDEYYGEPNKRTKTNKLTNLSIETLILCSDCGKYGNPMYYSFIKENHGILMNYCIGCSSNYKIDTYSFLTNKSENEEETTIPFMIPKCRKCNVEIGLEDNFIEKKDNKLFHLCKDCFAGEDND